MNLEFKKELPLIGIVLIPFVYLATIWKSLPEIVPIHWNSRGEIDGWGNKLTLIAILFMLPVLTYIVLSFITKIDPKKRMSLMGGKLYQLKFILVLFMSLLALFIIYSTKSQSVSSPSFVFALAGALFMILGNYFKVIRPNYFIGIKTPWTLENQEVWKTTHVFAGKLWFVGGLIIILGSLIFESSVFSKAFLIIVFTIAIVPIAYSYLKYRSLKKKEQL
ncbi:putative integral membrane protein [Flavobacterium anhuiense]|uniref:Putative integral membrane protein n=1 Tax=Flavobacterium anhuiense TaxID=459526 RepID=A0A444W4K6_9FLAO|nr:SdpI family protein [Flavobacterium anhuiense]RYJ40672.1 putative integral membrane protein [Flavobacterium anhuiense]